VGLKLFLGSSIGDLKSIRVGILLGDIRNPTFFAYLWQVIETLESQGCTVLLVDIPPEITRCDSPQRFLDSKLQKVSTDVPAKYKNEFISRVIQRPLNSAQVANIAIPNRLETTTSKISVSDVMRNHEYSELLKSSVASIYQTKLSGSIDLSVCPPRYFKGVANLVDSFINTKEYLKSLELDGCSDALVLMNGRQPHQAACIEYAEEFGLAWYSLEHGLKPGEGFHFEPFLPQDFNSIQRKYLKNPSIVKMVPKSFEETLHSWFHNQRYFGPSFGPKKSDSKESPKLSSKSSMLFTIFTSSLSEYDFIIQGQEKTWSQFQALEEVVRKIRQEFQSPEIIVRIHPNQRNYSWHDLIGLSRILNILDVQVVNPWDPLSSYTLIENSDYVVVWNSTIGLEAVYWGKRTVCLSSSYYNLIIDMPLLSPRNITEFKFQTATYPESIKALDGLRVMLYSGEEFKSPVSIKADLIKIRNDFQNPENLFVRKSLYLHLRYLFDGKYIGPLGRPVLMERIFSKLFSPAIAYRILNIILRCFSRS
jgi:hypothetical protein